MSLISCRKGWIKKGNTVNNGGMCFNQAKCQKFNYGTSGMVYPISWEHCMGAQKVASVLNSSMLHHRTIVVDQLDT